MEKLFIPSGHPNWFYANKGRPYQDVCRSSVFERPIVAWFKATSENGERDVRVLTKQHPASNVDIWTIVSPTGVPAAFESGTLEKMLQTFDGRENEWIVREFPDEQSFLHALFVFKFQS